MYLMIWSMGARDLSDYFYWRTSHHTYHPLFYILHIFRHRIKEKQFSCFEANFQSIRSWHPTGKSKCYRRKLLPHVYHLQMRRGNAFGRVCLSVCLPC